MLADKLMHDRLGVLIASWKGRSPLSTSLERKWSMTEETKGWPEKGLPAGQKTIMLTFVLYRMESLIACLASTCSSSSACGG